MDLDTAVELLYVVSPAEFIDRRNELAAEAQRADEKATASAIKKLRKPTLGAWLANLLARRRPRQIDELLRLGEMLRVAQLNLAGPELRELARERHEVIGTLVAEARGLARAAGSSVTDAAANELEVTLSAVLADADAATELRAGRLVSGLSYSGFGPLDGVVTAATLPKVGLEPRDAGSPETGVRPTKSTSSDDVRRRRRRAAAERALRQAEQAAADADRTLDACIRASDSIHDELDRRQGELHTLEQQLEGARSAVAAVERELQAAEKARGEAERRARAAGNRVAQAESAIALLVDSSIGSGTVS